MNSIESGASHSSCFSNNAQSKPTEQPSTHQKDKASKKSTKKGQNKREGGRWSQVQLFKYFLFLSHHQRRFEEDEVRRSLRMFKHMSMFIRTRKPSQCRVKHMKNMRKFGSVKNSIQAFVDKNPNFYEKLEKVKVFLQLLDDQAYCGEFQGHAPNVKPTLIPSTQNVIKKQEIFPLVKEQVVKIEELEQTNPSTEVYSGNGLTINPNVPLNMYWPPFYGFQPMFLYM